MASKKQLVPSEFQTIQSLPSVDSGFVGFGAKSDGLYMKFSNGAEYKLLSPLDGNLILSGTTIPNVSIGKIGDYYINNSDWTIYGPKFSILNGPGEGDSESWGTPTSLRSDETTVIDGGTASSVYGGVVNYDFGNASTI